MQERPHRFHEMKNELMFTITGNQSYLTYALLLLLSTCHVRNVCQSGRKWTGYWRRHQIVTCSLLSEFRRKKPQPHLMQCRREQRWRKPPLPVPDHRCLPARQQQPLLQNRHLWKVLLLRFFLVEICVSECSECNLRFNCLEVVGLQWSDGHWRAIELTMKKCAHCVCVSRQVTQFNHI